MQNMKQWKKDLIGNHAKKPMPILSFPAVSLLGVSVREMLADEEKMARGLVAVAKRINSAAAVSFMDLSLEAECFGCEIVMSEDEVPTVKAPILETIDDAASLRIPMPGQGRTQIAIDAISHAAKEIDDRPLFAGMIGPYSLAARLLDLTEIMMACYDDPDGVHMLLEKCTSFLTSYAKAFRAAGANGIVIAEPVAGLLSPSLEAEFSSPYVKRIRESVADDDFLLIYHNCGGGVGKMLDSILSIGADAYHFGNAIDLARDVLPHLPRDTIVMGNLDPAGILRQGTPESVYAETKKILGDCASHPGFLLSSGCDVPPLTPWENVDSFFKAAEDFYEQ